jgi:ABC-type Zn uptake system ZnuABC Zn-binding protein ZnuA
VALDCIKQTSGNGAKTLSRRRARGRTRPRVVLILWCILVQAFLAHAAAASTLRVVATTSDLASLARAVAGDLAQVETIVPPAADAEAFEPRPSDLAKLKGATVVVRVGLGYDHWLDKVLSLHADAAVNRGGVGYVDASVGIPLLEVKGSSLDPAARDGHAHGLANPHYWLDPANAEVITGGIAEAMLRVAPSATEKIIARRDVFLAELRARLADWDRLLAPHRGARLIAYHNTWPYFARRFRLNIVDVIEVKEGVAPSPARLAKLATIMREQAIRVILHEPFEPEETSQLLARRTGAHVVKLAPSVGSVAAAADYLRLFDYNVETLARALAATTN